MLMRENTMKPKNSIAKLKPTVRIVHIFASEIIKTDVENFRELVQRLTGKPSKKVGCRKRRKPVATNGDVVVRCNHSNGAKREFEEKGSFGGFEDIDGLFQGLGDLPLLSLGSSNCWI